MSWVLREVALSLPILVLVVWVALRRDERDELFWLMIGCASIFPLLLAFVLSSVYAGARRQHEDET